MEVRVIILNVRRVNAFIRTNVLAVDERSRFVNIGILNKFPEAQSMFLGTIRGKESYELQNESS